MFLIMMPSARAVDLRLRFSAAVEKLRYDNADMGVTGWAEEIKLRTQSFSNLEFISQSVGTLKLGYGFEGELLFVFSRRLGLGLSGGYSYGSLPEEDVETKSIWDGVNYIHTKPAKMSAYPVIASGYLFFPFGQKFNLYLRAGAGLVFAKFVGREGLKEPEEANFYYTLFETAKAQRTAYLGGLGLSYNFDDAFGFFIEAAARSGEVDGFTGEDNLQQPGGLYSYEEYISDLGYWQYKIHVLPEAPAGDNFREVRDASIDLGGYSVRLGLTIKF
jgi:opacity protein-like surface antigen